MAKHIFTHHCTNLWCGEKYYDCEPDTMGYCPSCQISPRTEKQALEWWKMEREIKIEKLEKELEKLKI